MDWTGRVMQEACQSSSWENLVDIVEMRIKKSKTLKKRFAEYTEYEQAIIVEQEIKNLEIESNKSLDQFGRTLKDTVDQKLVDYLSSIKSDEGSTNVEQLLNFSAKSIVDILEKSPPELLSTMKIFLNRRIPTTLRPYIWSYSLQIKETDLETLSSSRIAPSLDMFLSRRCHILLDRHFADISSRALAGLIKSVVISFMKNRRLLLPDERTEISSDVLQIDESETNVKSSLSSTDSASCEIFDRLVFLCVPLSIVIENGLPQKGIALDKERFFAFDDSIKLLQLIENGLQNISGIRHVAVFSEDMLQHATSLYLGRTQSLVKEKHPQLHDHIMTLTSIGVHDVDNIFYDFVNENLFRGLAGLLNVETCQYVWDQCFIAGFENIYPLVTASLVLGCSKEIIGITHADSAIDVWLSYCHHASIETIQRNLTKYCATELLDLFDKSSMYVLDYNEDDNDLLQVVVEKIRPDVSNPDQDSSYHTSESSPKVDMKKSSSQSSAVSQGKEVLPVSNLDSKIKGERSISETGNPTVKSKDADDNKSESEVGDSIRKNSSTNANDTNTEGNDTEG